MLGTTVPEATVDEDGEAPAGHHDVGGAALGELAVEPEAGALGVQSLAERDLWGRVLLLPPGEVPAFGVLTQPDPTRRG